MKDLSTRELRLAIATGVVVVCGITFMVVQAQALRLKELKERNDNAQLASLRQANLISKRPSLIQELEVIRQQLPRHPEGSDLKPTFSRQVQSLAEKSGLELTELAPQAEEALPEMELFRSAVNCKWNGTPDELIDFLVRLQQLGPVADVRDLRIQKASRGKEGVKGDFTLEFVYARVPPVDAASDPTPLQQSAEDGESP